MISVVKRRNKLGQGALIFDLSYIRDSAKLIYIEDLEVKK